MKTKQKTSILVILTAVVAYFIGAYVGFPFAQMGLAAGNIGHASKQQEQVNSPKDVKLAEKIETDTAFRNQMICGYGILYAQTKATIESVKSLKSETAKNEQLKGYTTAMDNVLEVGGQLIPLLENGLKGLQCMSEGKTADDVSMNLTQSLNLFQIMNASLSELDGFSEKTAQLVQQNKVANNLKELYSVFLIQSTDIAKTCGDKARVTAFNKNMDVTRISGDQMQKLTTGIYIQKVTQCPLFSSENKATVKNSFGDKAGIFDPAMERAASVNTTMNRVQKKRDDLPSQASAQQFTVGKMSKTLSNF